MTITIQEFFSQLFTNLPFLLTVLLTTGVILVNGWTDAPNAIATCVSTRAMRPQAAILMAAVMNFFGVLVMTLLNAKVAATISNMVNFDAHPDYALIALCAALFAIVIWAVAAWVFGIPTSESHALIAGISGAAIALNNGLSGINGAEWMKVIYGLVLSTFLGFGSGWILTKIIARVCRNFDRVKSDHVFRWAQIVAGAGVAFMHGAQDGQKFMGVFILAITLATGTGQADSLILPVWLMIFCALNMGLGTAVGGKKIIKSVGMDMVKMEKYQGFAASLGATLCLMLATFTGMPVSTTHTKTTAIMGVGAAKRKSSVKWSVAIDMVKTWVLTFPGCGLLGFVFARVFLAVM